MIDTHARIARGRGAVRRRPGGRPVGEGEPFLVALEEHFTAGELQRLKAGTDERLFRGGGARPELLDLDAGRIADMGAEWPLRRGPGPTRRTLPGSA